MLTPGDLSGRRWVAAWMERPQELGKADSDRLLALLAPDERAHYERLRPPGVRDTFLAGRALVRSLLAAATGLAPIEIRLTTGEHGKPRLEDEQFEAASVEFNLAHCPTHLVVALSAYSAVGVDVETVRHYAPRLPHRFFRREEVQLLDHLPQEARREAFFHLWVVKEACVKALGATLAPGLRAVPASLERTGRHLSVSWEMLEVAPQVKAAVAFVVPSEERRPGTLRRIALDEILAR